MLFSRKFYAACKRCLNNGGILVTQNGVPMFQPRELVSSVTTFRRLFADGTCYIAAIPTYVGGHMAMGFATDDKRLRHTSARTLAARYRRAGGFCDPILDAGGPRRRVRTAAFHRRDRWPRQSLEFGAAPACMLANRRSHWTRLLPITPSF